jgi:hypothetical protein
MYVTTEVYGSVSSPISVIDSATNTVVDIVNVSVSGPSYLLEYNPSNQYIYAGSEFIDTNNNRIGLVDVIDSSANTVVDTVETYVGPSDMEYNPSNQDMFVTTGTFLETGGYTYVIEDEASLTADAGPDQNVKSGAIVLLDGSASSDPSGGTLTYQWTQTSGPIVTLSDSISANPTFTAPDSQVQDTIVFELVVTNEQDIQSKPDTVTITINKFDSTPPPSPFDGILGSGNNFNFQIQENSGNNVGDQYGNNQMYSDESVYQGQSTEQYNSIVS